MPNSRTGPCTEPHGYNLHRHILLFFLISSHLHLCPPKKSLPFMFSDENSVHILHLTHALYIPHLLESLITLIIFGIECKLWTSSLCSFLRFPAYSQILCSTPLSDTLNHIFHLMLVKNALITHEYIWRAQVKVGLINLCKGLFSLNACIYYKLKSGT